MSDRQIREGLSRAVADATPDVLDAVLLRCERRKGAETDMSTKVFGAEEAQATAIPAGRERTKNRWRGIAAAVAAVVVLTVGGFFGIGYFSVDSVIGIDVNPSIEIRTNRSEKVLSVTAHNDDAAVVLDGMDLRNVDLGVAVNALIGSMLKHGYVSEITNSILITVENGDPQKGAQLRERLSGEIGSLLDAYAGGGAVLSQTLAEDERLKELAREHGISVGKAALVELLVGQDDRLAFADIAGLSINEINLLIAARQTDLQGVSASGSASADAYVGEERARAAALEYSGVAAEAVSYVKCKLDYDDGRMVYEVDFHTADAEYEVEIDALTGAVVSFDKDMIDRAPQARQTQQPQETQQPQATQRPQPTQEPAQTQEPQATQQPQATLQPSGDYIGEAAAKAAALAHAGLTESQVGRVEVSLDRDDGRVVYEVEFKLNRMEYEYDIDAATGAILEWDHDYDD